MYGIDGRGRHRSRTTTRGELFGAIDVALFILVIGGFLGVTMQTGAIQTGIARVVERLRGRERLMIPILMVAVRAGRHDLRHGRGEPRVLRARDHGDGRGGLRPLTGAAHPAARLRHRRAGLDINPFATGIASGFAGTSASTQGLIGRLVILVVGHGDRDLVGDALRRAGQGRPERSLLARGPGRDRRAVPAAADGAVRPTRTMTGRQKVVLGLFFLAFVVMIIGVVPWSDLGHQRDPHQASGGSRR